MSDTRKPHAPEPPAWFTDVIPGLFYGSIRRMYRERLFDGVFRGIRTLRANSKPMSLRRAIGFIERGEDDLKEDKPLSAFEERLNEVYGIPPERAREIAGYYLQVCRVVLNDLISEMEEELRRGDGGE